MSAGKFEKLRTSLNVLTGSAEEGSKAFERLVKFSAGTPFQLDELVKANNTLLGFGMSSDAAYKALRNIGDIAAVSGGDLKGISVAFGQVAASGRLMGQDLLQLINNGVPIIDMLASSMGVATSEVKNLVSEGAVTFPVLVKAFEDATKAGGQFAGGMELQSKTIFGLFSTLKDNVNIALAEIGNSLAENLDLAKVVTDLTAYIQRLTAAFKQLSPQAQKTIIAIAGVVAAIGPALIIIGKLSVGLSALPGIFAALTNPIGLTIAALGALVLAIDAGIQKWRNYERQAKITTKQQEELNRALSQTPLAKTEKDIMASKDAFNTLRRAMNLTGKDINRLSEGELTKFIDNLKKIGKDNQLWDYGKAQKLIIALEGQLAKVIAAKNKSVDGSAEAMGRAAEAARLLAEENIKLAESAGADILRRGIGGLEATLGLTAEGPGRIPVEDFTEDWTDLEPMEMPTEIPGSAQMAENWKAKQEMMAEVAQQSAQAIAQAFSTMGGQLFGDLQNSSNAFERFAGSIGAGVTEIIGMLLANAISNAILGGTQAGVATGPAAPFTTPAFIATAVGSVMAAFSSIPAFAQGGMVTGPTLAMVGDNASGKEAIIPFEKMGAFMNMMGGSNVNVNVTGQFDGDALRLVVDKSNRNNLNLR
jgi:tape measure domain-containing protein